MQVILYLIVLHKEIVPLLKWHRTIKEFGWKSEATELLCTYQCGEIATKLGTAPRRTEVRWCNSVRRQGFWDRWQPYLREGLADLVVLIMRRVCGEASAGFRWSFV